MERSEIKRQTKSSGIIGYSKIKSKADQVNRGASYLTAVIISNTPLSMNKYLNYVLQKIHQGLNFETRVLLIYSSK